MSGEEESAILHHQDSLKAVALTVLSEGEETAASEKEGGGASKGDDEALPDGWEKHESKSNPGMFYYFKTDTGEMLWERPAANNEAGHSPPSSPPMSPNADAAAPGPLHLQDIPIPPPRGAIGIVPSPKRRASAASSWSLIETKENTEPRTLKKTLSHVDHAQAMARNPDHLEEFEVPDNYWARLTKSLLAEFIGTYFLVSTVALSTGQAGIVFMAPLAIGLTLTVMIFAFGHISGAHFNPAVTLAVWLRGKIDLVGSACYLGAQLAGAFCAAYQQLLVSSDSGFTSGYPAPGAKVSWYVAVITEFTYTFALATVILQTATTKAQKGNSFFGLAIGMTVTSAAWAAGGISGGAFNPAVGTALPLVHGHYENIWLYWAGPCLGAAAASGMFRLTADPSELD